MAGLKASFLAVADKVATADFAWENFLKHEPLSAPSGDGVTCCVFPGAPMSPITSSSSLTGADARIEIMVRLLRNAVAEPQDERETDLIDAYDAVMTVLLGAYTLGGTVRSVDVLGESGQLTTGNWGYVQIDQTVFRMVEISVPLMVNECWVYGA